MHGDKIPCTRHALKQAFLDVAQEAYEIGLLAGKEVRLRESTAPGSADRPSKMDIRFDDVVVLATHRIWLRLIVLRSLVGAGYQRWVISAGCPSRNSRGSVPLRSVGTEFW
jgi:hypothetical protein